MAVYFIECVGADAIKIGYARGDRNGNIHHRVSAMQSGCPLPLKLLAVTDGAEAEEASLHARFSGDWIRGEWFRASDELRAFVAQFPEPSPRPRLNDPRYGRKPVAVEP